jgi:transposase InsO family protein
LSRQVSPTTGKPYGVKRVCETGSLARSTYYFQGRGRPLDSDDAGISPKARRGPVPAVSDADLLAAIREVIAECPFTGEGHRKVWYRLTKMNGLKVGRNRVLRLMREHNLLSPYRVPRGPKQEHEGQITTTEPNVMWGTDGTKVFTYEDGWTWIFSVLEHWNAECLGFHVCKSGDRKNALQAVIMAVAEVFGDVKQDAAKGLQLRSDHGLVYKSEEFQEQVKHWGMAQSFAIVAEPQTNGVVERFNRTLKEQVIYGRWYRNVQELHDAVAAFVIKYNEQWLVEKLGHMSPKNYRLQAAQKAVA